MLSQQSWQFNVQSFLADCMSEPDSLAPDSTAQMKSPTMKKVYIETYGCQMNVADTEVVLSVLHKAGYEPTTELEGADLAFMNTCAIRENAEEKVWNRLAHWKN